MEKKSTGDTLRIRISQLSNGVHKYHLTGNPSQVGLDDRFTRPVNVDAELDKTPGQVYLNVRLATSGKFQCDRCIAEFERELTASYSALYVYETPAQQGAQADDVRVITPDTAHLDLTEDVREMILLAVPLKLLCKEECRGLCPTCGTDWNTASCSCKDSAIDSRWQGLEGLLKN